MNFTNIFILNNWCANILKKVVIFQKNGVISQLIFNKTLCYLILTNLLYFYP